MEKSQKGEGEEAKLHVDLHTLTVMNISDHHTRTKVMATQQKEDNQVRVIGGLIGKQTGKSIEVHSSYELTYTEVEGEIIIDISYLHEKSAQLHEVFPEFEMFVGWYTTGSSIQPRDVAIHRQFLHINENPIVMVLDPTPCISQKGLPVFFYESETKIVSGEPTMIMSPITYNIITEESERVAVDHVAHLSSQSSSESNLSLHLQPVSKSVQMLDQRIAIIQAYLEAVKQGELPKNREILRRISCLCNALPIADNPQFEQDFGKEYNDTMLITYLAALTKGAAFVDDLSKKV